MAVRELIDKLNCEKKLSHGEWVKLIKEYDESDRAYASESLQGAFHRKCSARIST